MRIALLSETFLPKIDGITVTVCRFLDFLAGKDCETLLLAPSGGPNKYAATPVIGMPGFHLPQYPELKIVPPLVNVYTPLKEFQPDLVHLVNPASLGLAGLVAARLLRVPVVASYHTDIPGYADRWGVGFLRGAAWSYLRWIHNQAALNLTPSAFTLKDLENHGFRKFKVWAHGVDTDQFSPVHRSAAMRQRLSGGEPEKPLLLFVGRLSIEKRIDWLKDILLQMPGLRLAVIGDGPARRQLEEEFRGLPAVFTGYLRGLELSSAYASADILSFPSANETFGNAVLEAMASGLAVVVPNSGGVTDFVHPEKTGLVFDHHSPLSLRHNIERLVQNPQLRQQLGAAGRTWAVGHGWDSTFQNLYEDYRQLAAEKATARLQ